MAVSGVILLAGVLAVPLAALGALRWAASHGELGHGDRAALLPFDDEEPVGKTTDQILNRTANP
jgi:hypothetical protein